MGFPVATVGVGAEEEEETVRRMGSSPELQVLLCCSISSKQERMSSETCSLMNVMQLANDPLRFLSRQFFFVSLIIPSSVDKSHSAGQFVLLSSVSQLVAVTLSSE